MMGRAFVIQDFSVMTVKSTSMSVIQTHVLTGSVSMDLTRINAFAQVVGQVSSKIFMYMTEKQV